MAHSGSTKKQREKVIYIGSFSDETRLCPYEVISALLSQTDTWRTSDNQKRALFLITKEPHIPAAVGWELLFYVYNGERIYVAEILAVLKVARLAMIKRKADEATLWQYK